MVARNLTSARLVNLWQESGHPASRPAELAGQPS
jgi:hypothetical protein